MRQIKLRKTDPVHLQVWWIIAGFWTIKWHDQLQCYDISPQQDTTEF